MLKWTIIIVVYGTSPFSTGLKYDTLKECLAGEEKIHAQYVAAFEEWVKIANDRDATERAIGQKKKQMLHPGVCVPTAN